MIQNRQFRVKGSALGGDRSLAAEVQKMSGNKALRWYVSQIHDDEIVVEATIYNDGFAPAGQSTEARYYPGKSAVLSIIPTGVGCNIGGFAGDAAPVTNLLASTVDYLITNPNAVNASDFISLDRNVVYTEGSSIDLFCEGRVDLHIPYANKIGLIVDKSEERALDAVFNVLNAVRAIHGANVEDFVVTEQPIGGRCVENQSGAFVGTVDNPQVLFDACETLIARGVSAIAVTSNIQDLPPDSYARHFAGEYPNPVGGVEAIISHLITKRYEIPAAHAPLLNIKQLALEHNVVDARGAGEFASISGLACVLLGLQRAPQIKARPDYRIADIININNLLAIVAPASCMGGVPILATRKYGVPVIAVHENRTILDVTPAKINLNNVIEVHNYAEAAGVIMALKRGISLPSISRPLKTLRYTDAEIEVDLTRKVVEYEEQPV